MGERTEKVKKIFDRHKKKQKQIEKLHGTKSTIEKIEEVNKKISSYDLKIEKLQEKLSKLPSLDENKALREEYKEQIEQLENGYFDKTKSTIKIEKLQAELSETPLNYGAKRRKLQEQIDQLESESESEDVWVEGKSQCIKEKQKLELELKERVANKNNTEKALNESDEKLKSDLIQERKAINKDIETTKLKVQRDEAESKLKYQEIKDFEYKYEEYDIIDKNGEKVTKKKLLNQKELDALNTEYQNLQNNIKKQKEILEDLREAKTLCEKELAVFKKKEEKKMKAFNKAWNDTQKGEEATKSQENGGQGTKPPENGKQGTKPPENGKQGTKPPENGKQGTKPPENGKQGTKPAETKWNSKLTEEQIDDLKAEGIEPGDPEYMQYLKNHGIEPEKQEVKKLENRTKGAKPPENGNQGTKLNETKWNSKLTEEQIDDLKAEGIEPGDPEYMQYLKNHGIEPEKQEGKKPENGGQGAKPAENGGQGAKPAEVKWHPDLTKEQIDELKAEGIQPRDPEYAQYLKNYGIGDPKCSIHIGRKGFISYDGQEYKISKKAIKYGVNISSFSDKELDQYLKEEIGFNETGATRIKQLMGKGLIDITIIHAIHSTNMSQEQKHQLIQKYEYKAIYAQAGKERNDINVEYDMDDLSKASLWDRFLKREVNLDEKEKIFKNAVKAEKCKMGKIKGKYRPSLRERFLNRITGKQPLAFPTNKEEENHTNTKSKKVTEFKKQINEKAKERTGENTRGKEKQFKNANKNLANLMTSVHSDNQENSKEEGQKDGSAR